MNELKQGTPLQGGKYIIKRVLGQGGFGVTYLAEQVSLGREVAIKEFFMKECCTRDGLSEDVFVSTIGSAVQVEQYRKKFLKEARTLASLDHPHIVRVNDVFEENSTVYYVMPFLSGGSLKDLVNNNGPLLDSNALRYIRQIAEALRYMHEEKRICHYDVKPANILLDHKGDAVLIDFGISKNYDVQGNETSTTPIGISEGFAPIEQYQGIGSFSPASDVYALGATLYYLVNGYAPPSAVDRVQHDILHFGPSISPETRSIINQAMKLSLKERSQHVGVFLNHQSIKIKPNNRKPAYGYILSAIAALLFVSMLLHFHPWDKKDNPVTDNIIPQQLQQSDNEVLKQPLMQLNENMIWVEGGTFMMGAEPEQENEADDDESPVHQVTLSGFYICKYEVTQELWQTVMGSNPSLHKGDLRCPVEAMLWDECQVFISKLNQMTGKHYRLPTEAEWEFAARGGNKSMGLKYSGSDDINCVAWYSGNSGNETHPVGTKGPNELGLHDMSGNVLEWCSDWSAPYRPQSQTNPTGPPSGSNRVVRGGCSWSYQAKLCRVSDRDIGSPSMRACYIGLRLAMDAE